MIKLIEERLADSCKDRFRVLHVHAEEKTALAQKMLQEMKEVRERFNKKRQPMLLRREKVIDGSTTDYEEQKFKFDRVNA